MGAFEHLDDFAVGAAVGFDTGDADHDTVAVHGFLGGFGWYEDVTLNAFDGVIGDQKAVAVAMHLETADGEFAATRGDGVVPGAELDQLAARHQAGQGSFELFALFAAGAEFADQLLEVRAGVRESRDVVEQAGVRHTMILRSTQGVDCASVG